MDPSLYKDLTVSRGLTYHYYISKPENIKPWLVLLHGFPASSYDWKYQVAFFKERGFGLIVPDLLGYGGTSKPLEVGAFKLSLISKDIIDILDAESITEAIAIGHDWGSRLTARLYNYYSDRFKAYAFLSLWYVIPETTFDVGKAIEETKAMLGYDVFGYQLFFCEEDTDKVVEEHIDTFFDLLWAEDPTVWISDFAPIGALKAALLANKRVPTGSWLTEELEKDLRGNLLRGGLASPFQWYKLSIFGIDAEDNKSIPTTSYIVNKPTFFGATTKDVVSIASVGKLMTSQFCKGPTTIKDFDSGHWVMFERKDELNTELLTWIECLKA